MTSQRETAKASVFTVCRFGYRAHRITEGIYCIFVPAVDEHFLFLSLLPVALTTHRGRLSCGTTCTTSEAEGAGCQMRHWAGERDEDLQGLHVLQRPVFKER